MCEECVRFWCGEEDKGRQKTYDDDYDNESDMNDNGDGGDGEQW